MECFLISTEILNSAAKKEKIYMQENDNNSLAETLVNYEMLIEMIPELGEVVYTGMVTVDAARAIIPGQAGRISNITGLCEANATAA